MMDKQKQRSVAQGFIFKRRLALKLREDSRNPLEALEQLDGMLKADLSPNKHLTLRYDASRLQIDTVLQLLDAHQAPADSGLLNRWRLSWYRFVDENARNNARRTDIHCCNKPPVRRGR